MSSYVMEVRVKSAAMPTLIKYAQIFKESNPINPEWTNTSGKLLFCRSLNDAYFWEDPASAIDFFNQVLGKICEPNTTGKTMFGPPLTQLVGGEFGRRSYTLEFSLVGIIGDGLVRGEMRVIAQTTIKAEEYVGEPYTTHAVCDINLVIPENKVLGDYDLTPPPMQDRDVYDATRIDYAANRVIHEARNEQHGIVYYICTRHGNLLHRQTS